MGGGPLVARPEYEQVEKPLIKQLIAMGWEHLEGAPPGEPAHDCARSGRTSFAQVVVVTDRLDLEKQIRGSLGVSGEKAHRATSVKQARRYLAVNVPDLVLVTVQKARRDEDADDGSEERLAGTPEEDDIVHNRVVNPGHDIVLLVDEAHRSHATWQHARLRAMLPNAAMVGFTGTPIISKDAKTTTDTFGDYADIYTLKDAEEDGAVVPVRYEAHSVPLEVVEKAALDATFDAQVPADPQEREKVLQNYARKKEILEAPSVIAAKAEHMLRHWAKHALPDRFGAQIVARSRLAAVRYQSALIAARAKLLAELDALDPDLTHDPLGYDQATPAERELLNLLPDRHLLASVEAAVVITKTTSGRKDPADRGRWTARSRQGAYIKRFRKGIGGLVGQGPEDPSWDAETHGAPAANPGAGSGTAVGEAWHEDKPPAPDAVTEEGDGAADDTAPLAFLVVQSMLLTGFDAPVEQVLYLDRAIAGVDLLQAIARTNRPYPAKRWGQVVDYIGIGLELGGTLGDYKEEHLRQVTGYTKPTPENLWRETDVAADELLRNLHSKVGVFLTARRIEGLGSEKQREDLLAALADPLLRAEFDELVRDFLSGLNAVLPRPKALAYEDIARWLGEVQYLARRRYLDGHDQFSPRRYGAKIRQLISRHLKVSGIHERIPPVELSAPDFMARVGANGDARARTAYLTSRLEVHITARLPSGPPAYKRFSARLEEITRQMTEDFENAAAALAALVGEVNAADAAAPAEDSDGLDPLTERPVHQVLERALEATGQAPAPLGVDLLWATRSIAFQMVEIVRRPQFSTSADRQERARKELRASLEECLALDWDATGEPAGRLLHLALTHRDFFVRYGERQRG